MARGREVQGFGNVLPVMDQQGIAEKGRKSRKCLGGLRQELDAFKEVWTHGRGHGTDIPGGDDRGAPKDISSTEDIVKEARETGMIPISACKL